MRTLKGLMLTFCFSIIMIVASVSVVHAAYIVYEDGKRVYDLADLFTSYEEDKLTAYALEVEEEAKTEVYILTTDDTDGKSSMEYADDFGDKFDVVIRCKLLIHKLLYNAHVVAHNAE